MGALLLASCDGDETTSSGSTTSSQSGPVPISFERVPPLAEAYIYPLSILSFPALGEKALAVATKLGFAKNDLNEDGGGHYVAETKAGYFSMGRSGDVAFESRKNVASRVLTDAEDEFLAKATKAAGKWLFDLDLLGEDEKTECFGDDGSKWEAQWNKPGTYLERAFACPALHAGTSYVLDETSASMKELSALAVNIHFERRIEIGKDAQGARVFAPVKAAPLRVVMSAEAEPIGFEGRLFTIDTARRLTDKSPRSFASVIESHVDVLADPSCEGDKVDCVKALASWGYTLAADTAQAGGHNHDDELGFHDARLPQGALLPGVVAGIPLDRSPLFPRGGRWVRADSILPSIFAFDTEIGESGPAQFTLTLTDPKVATVRWSHAEGPGLPAVVGEGASIDMDLVPGENVIFAEIMTPSGPDGGYLDPYGAPLSEPVTYASIMLKAWNPEPVPKVKELVTDTNLKTNNQYEVEYFSEGADTKNGSLLANVKLKRTTPVVKDVPMVAAFGQKFWAYEIDFAADGVGNFKGTLRSDICAFSSKEAGNPFGRLCRGPWSEHVQYNPDKTKEETKDSTSNGQPTKVLSSQRTLMNLPGALDVNLAMESGLFVDGGPGFPGGKVGTGVIGTLLYAFVQLGFVDLSNGVYTAPSEVLGQEFAERLVAAGNLRPGVSPRLTWKYRDPAGLGVKGVGLCMRQIADACWSIHNDNPSGPLPLNGSAYRESFGIFDTNINDLKYCTGAAEQALILKKQIEDLKSNGGDPDKINALERKLDVPIKVEKVRLRVFTKIATGFPEQSSYALLIREKAADATLPGFAAFDGAEGPAAAPGLEAAVAGTFVNAFKHYYPMKRSREVKPITWRKGVLNGEWHNLHMKRPSLSPAMPSNIVAPGCANTFPMVINRAAAGQPPNYLWFMDPVPECVHYHSTWATVDAVGYTSPGPFETNKNQLDLVWAIVNAPAAKMKPFRPMRVAKDGTQLCTRVSSTEVSFHEQDFYTCPTVETWAMTYTEGAPGETIVTGETPLFFTR